jgi:hypothetical protein
MVWYTGTGWLEVSLGDNFLVWAGEQQKQMSKKFAFLPTWT